MFLVLMVIVSARPDSPLPPTRRGHGKGEVHCPKGGPSCRPEVREVETDETSSDRMFGVWRSQSVFVNLTKETLLPTFEVVVVPSCVVDC